MSIEDGESVATQKDSWAQTGTTFSIGDRSASFVVCVEGKKFVTATIDVTAHQNVTFARIMRVVY